MTIENFIAMSRHVSPCLGATKVDHGFGAGDSGLSVYVAGAAEVTPRQIFAAAVPWCETKKETERESGKNMERRWKDDDEDEDDEDDLL